jgi:chloride channel, nucleotide-sensitive, 1A
MQLISPLPEAGAGDEDEEPDSISLTIIPQNDAPPPPTTTDPESRTEDHTPQPPTVAMFTALSDCSNLHPDPIDDELAADLQSSTLYQAGMISAGNGDGGLPPPVPGSGGWITAENMGEYFDEEGNWIGGDEEGEEEALGPGAGSVRPREGDEEEGVHENGANEEAKWRRTG